jgi:hypothetical protein
LQGNGHDVTALVRDGDQTDIIAIHGADEGRNEAGISAGSGGQSGGLT